MPLRIVPVILLLLAASCDCSPPLRRDSSDEDRRITLEVRRIIVGVQINATQFAQVQVTTHDGIVQLLGPVSSGGEKALIGALSEKVPGVRRVDNQLDIRPP